MGVLSDYVDAKAREIADAGEWRPEAASILAEAADYRYQTFHALSSSNLDSAAYSDVLEVLWIRFKSGSVYAYVGVPQAVFDGLTSAGSAGGYHHRSIRCTYRYELLEGGHSRDEDCFSRTR